MSKKSNKKIIEEDNTPFSEDLYERNALIASQIMRMFQIYGKDDVIKEFKYILGNG